VGTRLNITVAALGFLLVAVLVASGLRYVPGVIYVYSPPICGPLKDQYENPAGNAGPCPSPPPVPQLEESHWEWAPFWEPPPG
jgi:hypothetical protein